MSASDIAALVRAYHALDRLPNHAKQATEAGTTMANIRRLLKEAGVEVS